MTQATTVEETSQEIAPTIDRTPKGITLPQIIKNLKKTGSVSDTAKILSTTKQNINQRLKRAKIDIGEFLDYAEDKGLSHEILQYRIARGLTSADIKKMAGGSKVLAIAQLDDKIRAHRGEGETKNSISVILNMACQANEKTIEIKAATVENSSTKSVDK